ncbi:MAG: DNA-directed RNA polymerase subunit omega [Firmicutes bacterium]|nr:DNA-directed RNA polymerase subunit omega [Bacillota bacterium]
MKSVSLDELIDKVSCRYELVTVISKRAKMLIDNPDSKLLECGDKKPVIQAALEFSNDCYTFHHSSEQ